MTATKTNERPGTRARASYVRSSAYKAREVLDLIRHKSCADAHDILAFSERDVAQPIAKVLDSALANAEHNDGLDADELYVSACYADEGPTLKRWRPRARGRATRIRKRTCHITVIVSRYDPETLERMQAQHSRRGAVAAEARRRRVARSRAAAAQEVEAATSDDEADVEAQASAVVQATEAALAEDPATEIDEAEAPDIEASEGAEPSGDGTEAEGEEPGKSTGGD
ncbi:MAG: 50S ribosomal protein L22 [Acidimicrobiaceae bacterium]|nr:50S ribosomal protein L22 [Acidimicrobiaceae bacterium]